MSYVLTHTRLGFCWWDLAALIVLLVVVAFFVVNHRKLKKQLKELEEVDTAYDEDEAEKSAPYV
jgi:hypothetical protein